MVAIIIIAIIADNIHVAVLIVAGVIIQIVCYIVIHELLTRLSRRPDIPVSEINLFNTSGC